MGIGIRGRSITPQSTVVVKTASEERSQAVSGHLFGFRRRSQLVIGSLSEDRLRHVWGRLRSRDWHNPVEERAATIIHDPQSVGLDGPRSRSDKALRLSQGSRFLCGCKVKGADDLGQAPSEMYKLDHERHGNLLEKALWNGCQRLGSNHLWRACHVGGKLS
jgi:hypothetical protein